MTQPTMAELLVCELCATRNLDVHVALAWYRDAEPGHAIQPIARCKDAIACRERVEQRGEHWPLRERGE